MGMIIDKFLPDYFEGSAEIDYAFLEEMFGHKMQYAAKGRHSIRHIIAASGRSGAVVIPVYACSSIPEAIRKTGNEIVYCDIDERDLNISVEAFKRIVSTQKVAFLLAPSLYGNPADLETLEQICRENDIYMIDDAAQSLGAKIGSRYVGSFGNAGFFAFSPGKPLTSSMGSFFWTDNADYRIDYKYGHRLLHKVAFDDFYYNRFKIYERGKYSPYKVLTYLNILLQKKVDILYDGAIKYEEEAIGALLEKYKIGDLDYRNTINKFFIESLEGKESFRVLKGIRGESNNQKIVLIFREKEHAFRFRQALNLNGIYTNAGYSLLTQSDSYPVASEHLFKIVEIPIERSDDKMQMLLKLVKNY